MRTELARGDGRRQARAFMRRFAQKRETAMSDDAVNDPIGENNQNTEWSDGNVSRRSLLFAGTALAAWGLAAAALINPVSAQVAPATKPNVVFILADNVGYGDLGPYGGGELRGAPTPRIDQLAKEGLRLTQYLVEPACTPSRAALMTGRYSIREGLSLIIVPGTDSTLSAHAYTMGDMFHNRLRYGDFRQVAPRLGTAEPADRTWFR
jgi:Sulfatase